MGVKVYFLWCFFLLSTGGWAQDFGFFDKELNPVKEKKAVYYSLNTLSGEGREYLILNPAPDSGLDTVLAVYFKGKMLEWYPFEWEDVPETDVAETDGTYRPEEEPGNLKAWLPDELKDDKPEEPGILETVIFARFTVTEKGEVTNIQVLKNPYPALTAEVVRAIRNPNVEGGWKPRKIRGKPVPVRLMMPVLFKLSPSEKE